MNVTAIGPLLRDWRRRRRVSQLDLAAEARVSQRHLSFVETSRAAPSRDMVLRLAQHLEVPLRDRNTLLAAAGFAPLYAARPPDSPDLAPAYAAVEVILAGHDPHPALALDRHWTLVRANRAVGPLLEGVDAALLRPPVNALRLTLHPQGLAPRVRNFRDWRAHVLDRLARQIDASADPDLAALARELAAYPVPTGARPPRRADYGAIATTLELDHPAGRLAFLTTTTVFGTALDITLSELTIESFFPADAFSAATMRRLAGTA